MYTSLKWSTFWGEISKTKHFRVVFEKQEWEITYDPKLNSTYYTIYGACCLQNKTSFKLMTFGIELLKRNMLFKGICLSSYWMGQSLTLQRILNHVQEKKKCIFACIWLDDGSCKKLHHIHSSVANFLAKCNFSWKVNSQFALINQSLIICR